MDRFLGPGTREDHAQFDLPGFILARLGEAEIGEAAMLNLCTYADPERFYSYRRTTHRGEPDYGRLISAIALRRPDLFDTADASVADAVQGVRHFVKPNGRKKAWP